MKRKEYLTFMMITNLENTFGFYDLYIKRCKGLEQ